MKRIEIMGPSCVGKSTLHDKLSEIAVKDRPYMTLKDAFKHAAIHKEVSLKNLDLWTYKQFLKFGLFKSKSRGLGKTVIYNLWNKSERDNIDNYKPFTISNNTLLEHLKSYKDIYKSCRHLKRFKKRIDRYLMLNRHLPEECFVLIDEGILHYHPGITEYAIETYTSDDLQKDVAFNPAGIISCEQSAEIVYKQALERKKKGIRTFAHDNLNNEELRKHVKGSVERYKEKIKRLEDYNIPVLHINTKGQMDSIIAKIDDFVLGLNDKYDKVRK
jgi:hypothetical protein